MNPKLLEILACPMCKAKVEYVKAKQRLICHKCKLVYRIDDGIPVMLINEAEQFNES